MLAPSSFSSGLNITVLALCHFWLVCSQQQNSHSEGILIVVCQHIRPKKTQCFYHQHTINSIGVAPVVTTLIKSLFQPSRSSIIEYYWRQTPTKKTIIDPPILDKIILKLTKLPFLLVFGRPVVVNHKAIYNNKVGDEGGVE